MAQRTCTHCGATYSVGGGYGMCPKHYKAWKKYGDPDGKPEPRKRVVGVEPCSIDGCDRPQSGRGWCGMHNYRRRTYGAADHRFGWEVRGGCKVCPRCGVDKPLSDYSPAASVCKACNALWAREHRRNTPRARQGKLRVVVCDFCERSFVGDGKRSRYCSSECFDANRNKANWKYVNKRRALLREALVESFDRVEIFERDDWVCQLCGTPVDRLATFPAPLSASLDHIIPISRGGTHEPGNAQCSHLRCNVSKGARMD